MKELTKDLEEDKKEKSSSKEKIEEAYEEDYSPEDYSSRNYQEFKRPINKFREVTKDEFRRRKQRDMRRMPGKSKEQENYTFRGQEVM